MAARAETPSGGNAWRLWALGPILLLAAVVGIFVTSGSWIVDQIGRNPPAADVFDVRRVEFRTGEIRIRVTNPQVGREPYTSLAAPGTYQGNTQGKQALVSTYRYPDAPDALGIATRLAGPEQVFRLTVRGRVANFGAVVLSRARGVRIEPREAGACTEDEGGPRPG